MSAIVLDRSRKMAIYSRKGQDFDITMPVKNSDTTDFIFTDYEAELLVYTSFTSESPLFQFTTDNGSVILSDGSIRLYRSEPINSKKEELVYVLWITDSEGKRQPWLNGPFVVLNREWDGATPEETDTITIAPNGDDIIITISPDIEDYPIEFKVVSGVTYTVLASDNGKMIHYTSNSNVTITLPNDLVQGHITQHVTKGTGDLIFSATGTLQSIGDTLADQYTAAMAVHEGSNVWGLYGKLT